MTTATDASQVQNLTSHLLPAPSPDGADATKPRVAFATDLGLTREQEDAMVTHALDRLAQIEGQLGLRLRGDETTGSEHSITCDPDSFFGRRERWTAQYYNKVKWRQTGARPGEKGDTIYNHSNLTASLSQRTARQMVAKATGFFLGPPDDNDWFTTDHVGDEDLELSETLKRHSRWKLRQCRVKDSMRQAIEMAFVRGEAVVKVTHQERGQLFQSRKTFLVGEDGEPIFDRFGDYILDDAAWVEELLLPEEVALPPETVTMGGEPAVLPPPAEPVPTGRMLLKKDGTTIQPEAPQWKTDTITRRRILFRGPEAKVVYFKDFLCPEAAEDIQTADLIAQLYDMPLMRVAEMFATGIEDNAVANLQEAIERLREIAAQNSHAKSAQGQPREDRGETDTAGSPNAPTSQFAEVYMTYDANGDGVAEEIMLVVDRVSRAPIFYDYTANVTVTGLRPFRVLRPIEVDGRWYGMGAMELFEPEQEAIDLQLNRKNFADGKSGRIDFFRPYNTVEGESSSTNGVSTLQMHWGGTYTPLPGKKAEDVIETVYLENDGEMFEFLLTKFEQYMMLKSGTANAADQEASSLPTAETATGINEVRSSGEELFSLYLAALFTGINDTLTATIEVMYANHHEEEIFHYFDGEAQQVLALTPDDVRDLPLNVSLVLSRTQEQRTLDRGERVDAIVDAFYVRPPEIQERTKELARANLRAHRVANADKIIEPLMLAPTVLPGGAEAPTPAKSAI